MGKHTVMYGRKVVNLDDVLLEDGFAAKYYEEIRFIFAVFLLQLAGGSDCAKAIRLGALYVSNPIGNVIYAQNVVCVIESCQSISNNEGANIYCNWKKKSGPHWNCSWFTGIGHTESFHYHA